MLFGPRNEDEGGGDNMYRLRGASGLQRLRCSQVSPGFWLHQAPEMQPERVSIYNPCHTPQNTVSLKRSPRGSSGINGDVDIFRQSVYLILMLSN